MKFSFNAKCMIIMFGWILALTPVDTLRELVLAIIGAALISIGCKED